MWKRMVSKYFSGLGWGLQRKAKNVIKYMEIKNFVEISLSTSVQISVLSRSTGLDSSQIRNECLLGSFAYVNIIRDYKKKITHVCVYVVFAFYSLDNLIKNIYTDIDIMLLNFNKIAYRPTRHCPDC